MWHPIRDNKRKKAEARAAVEAAEAAEAQRAYDAEVNETTARHLRRYREILQTTGLDPHLPELKGMEDYIREQTPLDVTTGTNSVGWVVEGCNPDAEDMWTITEDGEFQMADRFCFGGQLSPYTIAAYQLPKHGFPTIEERLVKIVVNQTGGQLFDKDGKRLMYLDACRLDPHRLGDDGSRLKNTSHMIEHFTGLAIDWREFWQKYSVTVINSDEGWSYAISDDKATAHTSS